MSAPDQVRVWREERPVQFFEYMAQMFHVAAHVAVHRGRQAEREGRALASP